MQLWPWAVLSAIKAFFTDWSPVKKETKPKVSDLNELDRRMAAAGDQFVERLPSLWVEVADVAQAIFRWICIITGYIMFIIAIIVVAMVIFFLVAILHIGSII